MACRPEDAMRGLRRKWAPSAQNDTENLKRGSFSSARWLHGGSGPGSSLFSAMDGVVKVRARGGCTPNASAQARRKTKTERLGEGTTTPAHGRGTRRGRAHTRRARWGDGNAPQEPLSWGRAPAPGACGGTGVRTRGRCNNSAGHVWRSPLCCSPASKRQEPVLPQS